MNENKLLASPKIYLVSKQVLDNKGLERFLSDENLTFETDTSIPAEIVAETAGRVCYMSFGKGRKTNKDYLDNIISSHHGSVLEHTVWGFLVTGISRSLTHELIRHRAGMAFSQLSQRYVDESEARYVIPPLYQKNEALKQKWLKAIEVANSAYAELVEESLKFMGDEYKDLSMTDRRKIVRQSARSVLPNATETKMFITGNGRAWRHICEMRGSIHADTEIRNFAVAIAKILKEESPNIFQDLTIKNENGIETVEVVHSKV